MKRVTFNKNILYIQEKAITFDCEIYDVKTKEDKILVLLEVDPQNLERNNLCCFSLGGELLWKIGPTEELGNRFPFVGIRITDTYTAVVDFIGRRFYFNINDGELIGMDIVK